MKEAFNVLKFINEQGFEAYIVGGFVRDYLLNIKSYDIDIATNMSLDELSKHFKIDNIKHSSFRLYSNDECFEVTLFREELSYEKQRHPIIKLVNSFKEDYIRRDFTINSLGMSFKSEITDFCNGRKDLSNKIIKTIREPNLTFIEDPVRILRAIYLKNKLNFKYDEETYSALLKNVSELSVISNNRIIQELNKMILFNFDIFIDDIINTNAYKYIFDLKDTLLYIHDYKININCLNDIIYIHYYLNNDISKWEINSKEKKYIKKIVDASHDSISNLFLFERTTKEIEDICIFMNLINRDIDKDTLINIKNNFIISNVNDIQYSFNKDTIKYKNIIITNILDCKLKNNKEDIINFINML